MADLLRMLAAWLELEPVVEQMGMILDPPSEGAIEFDLLEKALAKSELAQRLETAGQTPKTMVHTFIRTFVREIEESDVLGRHLDTRLLRVMEAKLEAIRTAVVPDLDRLERICLERICAETRHLNLRGLLEEALEAPACGAGAPRLADVYIQLDTTATRTRAGNWARIGRPSNWQSSPGKR